MKVVRNVNKGKRRTRKHHYTIGTAVVFKWDGFRDYGYIGDLTNTNDGYSTYTIRSTGSIGCIYHEMEMDDASDPYSYLSSILTKSISQRELDNISKHKQNRIELTKSGTPGEIFTRFKVKKNSTTKKKKTIKKSTKSELDAAIQKQKDFIDGSVNKFWN